LFVCQHGNFRTSKHRMMKLEGVGALYKNLGRVRISGHSNPLGARHHENVAFGYDVGKISTGCLVFLSFRPSLYLSRAPCDKFVYDFPYRLSGMSTGLRFLKLCITIFMQNRRGCGARESVRESHDGSLPSHRGRTERELRAP